MISSLRQLIAFDNSSQGLLLFTAIATVHLARTVTKDISVCFEAAEVLLYAKAKIAALQ